MSLDLGDAPPREPAPLPVVRWVGLGVLLVAELVVLSLRFDTASLEDLHTWWADLFGQVHVLPKVALAVAAATFLFGGERLWVDLRHAAQGSRALPAWPFLLGHLAALAGFTLLTAYILEGDARNSPFAAVWAVAWAALAVLTLALWLAAALPAERWLTLARRGAGPLLAGALIGLAAWGAAQLTDLLWAPLGRSTFWLVCRFLGWITPDVVCDPATSVVGTPSFTIWIKADCSGYEGIGLVWVFVGVFLWSQRRELRFPAALVLLPAATVVVWLCNAVRITALIAVGTWVSPDAAMGGFHSQAGWLMFTAIALGVVVVARRAPWIAARSPLPPEENTKTGAAAAVKPDATTAYLAPLLVLVATMMTTAAFVSGFDWAYPARVVLTGGVLWYFRRSYTDLRWGWSWEAVGLGAAVFVVWLVLEPSHPADATYSAALGGAPGWAAAWLVFRVIGTVATVPLAEELAFRGFLTRRLIATDFDAVQPGRFTWLSFLVSSILFGLLHGRWAAGILAGMAYAVALYRRRRLCDAVLAHAVTNALLAGYVLATGSWQMW